jgi:hypothetical protein
MQVGFATRDENLILEGAYKAINISTLIDRADASMFKGKPPFRNSYDFLAEFAHPNHGGVLSLYSDNYPDQYRVEFGNTIKKGADTPADSHASGGHMADGDRGAGNR